MQSRIIELYEALGLELDVDEPVLRINDDLQIYFDESEGGLEMCCPLMALPDETALLQECLRMNYAGPIVLAADEDNTVILALHRISEECTVENLLSGLELLVNTATQLRSDMRLVR